MLDLSIFIYGVQLMPAPTKPVQKVPTLPAEGYVRVQTVLAVLPIGKSSWWQGVKNGKYPQPIKLSPRVTAWAVTDIRKLLASYAGRSETTSPVIQPEEIVRIDTPKRNKPRQGTGLEICSSSSSSSRSSRSLRTTASSKGEVRAGFDDGVLAFLDWWRSAYEAHNDGAVTTLNIKRDGPLVADLLKHRPRERLQAMAEVLWTITPEEDEFIYKTDRSLKILRHTADRLDRYVVARQRVGDQLPSRSKETDGMQARIARIIVRLERHQDGELGAACGTVITALRSGQTNFAELDAMLLIAARSVIDPLECEADARGELEGYQARMPEHFGEALRAAIDKNLRTRADLPNLLDLCSAR